VHSLEIPSGYRASSAPHPATAEVPTLDRCRRRSPAHGRWSRLLRVSLGALSIPPLSRRRLSARVRAMRPRSACIAHPVDALRPLPTTCSSVDSELDRLVPPDVLAAAVDTGKSRSRTEFSLPSLIPWMESSRLSREMDASGHGARPTASSQGPAAPRVCTKCVATWVHPGTTYRCSRRSHAFREDLLGAQHRRHSWTLCRTGGDRGGRDGR